MPFCSIVTQICSNVTRPSQVIYAVCFAGSGSEFCVKASKFIANLEQPHDAGSLFFFVQIFIILLTQSTFLPVHLLSTIILLQGYNIEIQ